MVGLQGRGGGGGGGGGDGGLVTSVLTCGLPRGLQEPVILTDTGLVKSGLKWSPDYLAENIGTNAYSVYFSNTQRFLYYDPKKIIRVSNFHPPTTREDMTFQDFLNKVRHWKEGDP